MYNATTMKQDRSCGAVFNSAHFIGAGGK